MFVTGTIPLFDTIIDSCKKVFEDTKTDFYVVQWLEEMYSLEFDSFTARWMALEFFEEISHLIHE